MIALRPDNPLIVQSDRTLLLEVAHPAFEQVRDELARFAELVKSPEHIHTYRITPLSLWNASASGVSCDGDDRDPEHLVEVSRSAEPAAGNRGPRHPLWQAPPGGQGRSPGPGDGRPGPLLGTGEPEVAAGPAGGTLPGRAGHLPEHRHAGRGEAAAHPPGPPRAGHGRLQARRSAALRAGARP